MLIETALSPIVLFTAFQMINRKKRARKVFLLLLPILGVVGVFRYYSGISVGLNGGSLYEAAAFGISLLIVGGFTSLYMIIYTRSFMIDFFEQKSTVSIESFGEKEEKE